MPNRNTYWANLLVNELAKAGLRHVCLAPGSRSTPLVMAFAQHESIRVYTHLDERSAAFFALGLAKASQKPCALVCTSGTAALNFFPAIVEAHESAVPLIVLTADRPHELRDSGANQSIKQVNLYGSYALWSVDVALPESDPGDELVAYLRATAVRAYANANGMRKGVVHLNLPFRKPLEPSHVKMDKIILPDVPSRQNEAYTGKPKTAPFLSQKSLFDLRDKLLDVQTGLIICGVDCPRDPAFAEALKNLTKVTGFPILADAASGLRMNEGLELSSAFDSFLGLPSDDLPKPDLVIRFGKMPTSATLQKYLKKVNPKHDWQISSAGLWADDSHHLSLFIQADEADTCQRLSQTLLEEKYHANNALQKLIDRLEQHTWNYWEAKLPEYYFDASAVYSFIKHAPNHSVVFVGNSLSIRHVDQFARHEAKNIRLYANRGASGIDGNISTALGLGAAYPTKRLFMILGDLSFYHDMNGLLAVHRLGIPVTILLVNNAGGGIFHRLPIAQFEPEFTDYFLTPHELDFSYAASLYGLKHIQITDSATMKEAFALSQTSKYRQSYLLEVKTDASKDHAIRLELMQTYKQFMKAKMYPDPNDTSVDSHIDLSGKPAQSTNNFEKEQGI